MKPGTRQPERLSLAIYSIGVKLRALRSQKGLTLLRLAAETGLSTALLSKLETDRMIPTLLTLASLCRVYGVGLGFFFADATKHSMSITRNLLAARHGKRQLRKQQFPLNANAHSSILVTEVDLPPEHMEALTEIGKVFNGAIYVLEGSLQLESAGQKDVLEAGDCVCLESEMVIMWGASETSRCRVLVVTSV